MNTDDTIEIDLTILPKDKRLQFEALGTKKASKLIRKQIESDMRKGRTQAIELLEKSKALDSALAEGEEVHALWPDSLAECISILAGFSVFLEYSAEEYLLQMSSEQMAVIEQDCRQRGISYEELTAEALWALRNGKIKPGVEEDELDAADWWKET